MGLGLGLGLGLRLGLGFRAHLGCGCLSQLRDLSSALVWVRDRVRDRLGLGQGLELGFGSVFTRPVPPFTLATGCMSEPPAVRPALCLG